MAPTPTPSLRSPSRTAPRQGRETLWQGYGCFENEGEGNLHEVTVTLRRYIFNAQTRKAQTSDHSSMRMAVGVP
jgi:hypothetical protein